LRDSALLAHQLTAAHRGEEDLLPALREYERRMLAYGFEAVTTSLDFARRFTSDGFLPRQGMRAWLRLSAAIPRIKRGGFRQTWTDDLPPVPRLV
jgi:2-polyprenyl-6-methoxyphenol hydroxylase-like FAD-dependent oxidoreductase